MKTIGQISIEEETIMNTTINDSMMVPIMPFERQIFEMVDAETGDLFSVDKIPSFLNFIKEEHSVCHFLKFSPLVDRTNDVTGSHSIFLKSSLHP